MSTFFDREDKEEFVQFAYNLYIDYNKVESNLKEILKHSNIPIRALGVNMCEYMQVNTEQKKVIKPLYFPYI
jgi:hypothetical protein